jgi:hypothetical protein
VGGIITTLALMLMTPGGTRQFRLEETEQTAPARRFFRTDGMERPSSDWTVLRAIAALLGLILLITAVAL